MSRQMCLSLIVVFGPSPHPIGSWRHPRSFNGFRYDRAEYWEHIARTLERGKFDMLFFADTYNLHDTYAQSPDLAIRYALQYPRQDPVVLVPIVARATRNLAIGLTASTTFIPPFYLARKLATLDHLTEGRLGWNVVTSFGANEAANFGLVEMLSHAERYDRADEYMKLCYKLWHSWDADAVIMDRENGYFADPAKVHRVDHVGTYFRCRGPLSVPRSPQGIPLIIQAGQSPDGIAFAARHAEATFAIGSNLDGIRRYRCRLNAALREQGRRPEDVRVLWGTLIFVGETGAEARAKQQRMIDNIPVEAGLALMSGHHGIDFSKFPREVKLKNLKDIQAVGNQGLLQVVLNDYGDELTLAEAAKRYGYAFAGLPIVGTPSSVADQMEEILDAGEGDGFNVVTSDSLPGSIEDVVDFVVPELQRRGLFRTEYGPETTLRERLFGVGCTSHPGAAHSTRDAVPSR